MNSDECMIGSRVVINQPWNTLLHGATGTVVSRDSSDEAQVRFDVYREEFDQYEDTRSGSVTVDPANLDPAT